MLTLTSFATADQGNIGLVRFEAGGEGYAVFVPKFGGDSDPGEPLAFGYFSDLVVGASVIPSSSSTTTTQPGAGTTEPG